MSQLKASVENIYRSKFLKMHKLLARRKNSASVH